MAFANLNELLAGAVRRAGIQTNVQTALILERAAAAIKAFVGPDAEEVTRPVFVRRNVLTIATVSASAAALLSTVETEILEYINRGFDRAIIKKITIVS